MSTMLTTSAMRALSLVSVLSRTSLGSIAHAVSILPVVSIVSVGSVLSIGSIVACRPRIEKPDTRALPSPREALEALAKHAADRRSMRAMGRVTYFGSEGRIRLRTVLLAERESRFRVEVLSPAEEPVGIMTCDGDQLWLLKDRRLSTGPATPENIARLIPMPMDPQEVVDVLLGGIPASDRLQPVALAWTDGAHTGWDLTLEGPGDDVVRLEADPVRHVVTRAKFMRAGALRLTVEFEDFNEVIGTSGEFPRKIAVQIPGQEDVRIKLEDVDVNAGLDPSLFRLTAPHGVAPLPMGDPATDARKVTPTLPGARPE